MPPAPGVRPDLATRLRRSKRALTSRLGKPETQLLLIRAAHDSLDPAKIGELIVERAMKWLAVSHCAVVAADAEGQLSAIAANGTGGRLSAAALDVGRWVLASGREFASANLRRDRRVQGACGAVIAVPLRCRTQIVAAVVMMDRAAAAAEPEIDQEIGELFAVGFEGPAVALDNALRMRRAEALSVTDDLTQLYNSRYLNLALRRETKRASRSGRPLSLLFVDLDGFKAVNDTHGHLVGSRTLVEVAQVIRGSARETDVAARFGGDEFALVLPETGTEGAVAVAERVRERISRRIFLAAAGFEIRVTVSIGVATLPDVAASADELVKAADTAMYQVKAAGSNGVVVARGDAQ